MHEVEFVRDDSMRENLRAVIESDHGAACVRGARGTTHGHQSSPSMSVSIRNDATEAHVFHGTSDATVRCERIPDEWPRPRRGAVQ